MTNLFDAVGALLYFVLSIVLIPLFLLTDLCLWAMVATRNIHFWYRKGGWRFYRKTSPTSFNNTVLRKLRGSFARA